MRKSGWTAATGIGSLVLLLAACGGSSGSTSAAGSGSSAGQPSSGSSGPAAPVSSVSAASTATSAPTAKATKNGGGSSPTGSATPHHTAGPQPSSNSADQSIPPVGTTVMIVQHSAIGFVLAEANGQVVYTYANDKKGGLPTCTGSCAATWSPATGTPQAGPADHFPGTFGLVKGAGGVEQITYNGMPLYTLKGAKPYAVTGNGVGGVWHVVPLSVSDIG
jgi:predicted lipoprotein with Yx(FWY)xxD motif